jgi:hypothetical protein
MSAFLVLEPLSHCDGSKTPMDWQYLTTIIKKYEDVQIIAASLAGKGWNTTVVEDGGFFVICRPPEPVDTIEELQGLIEKTGVCIEKYGDFDLDDDFNDEEMTNGDVSTEDFDEDCCCNYDGCGSELFLMTKEVANTVTGKKISFVEAEEDKVSFHLDDGKKLIYDDYDGFYME